MSAALVELTLEAEATRLQQEIKELAQKNEKLTEDYNQTQTNHQQQLKKINVLFDSNANNYERIDFEGLYSLLQQIAEREESNKTLLANLSKVSGGEYEKVILKKEIQELHNRNWELKKKEVPWKQGAFSDP